jgi:thiamine pyrophosphate-dependent acetolactate synthase large subunit-like protein
VRLDINLTIVVLNDNGFGMIKWKQNAAGYSMLVPLNSLFLVST